MERGNHFLFDAPRTHQARARAWMKLYELEPRFELVGGFQEEFSDEKHVIGALGEQRVPIAGGK